MPCYPKQSPPIDVLTISNDFRHKTGIITTYFNCFLVHIATTRGSMGVISGGHSTQNRQNHPFLPCYPKQSPPVDVLTISNDFRHKTGIITTHFNCFMIHIATTRGSMVSFPGVIRPKIDKKPYFIDMLS